jgi:hypothetical protein
VAQLDQIVGVGRSAARGERVGGQERGRLSDLMARMGHDSGPGAVVYQREAQPRSASGDQQVVKLESLTPAGQSDIELAACGWRREAEEDPGAPGNADGGNGGS